LGVWRACAAGAGREVRVWARRSLVVVVEVEVVVGGQPR
jgi:hypothetical protein